MAKSLVALACAVSLAGCVGGKTDCIASGTAIAIGRTDPSGDCGSDVVAGITALNQTFTPAKALSCGVTHFSLTTDFIEESGSGAECQGSDAISFEDLGSDGGSGTDVMSITCPSSVSCTETFAVTFAPQ